MWIKFFWVTNHSNMHWLKIAIIFFLHTYDFQVEVGGSDLSRQLWFILGSDGLGFLLGLSLSMSANSGVQSGEITATGGCSSPAWNSDGQGGTWLKLELTLCYFLKILKYFFIIFFTSSTSGKKIITMIQMYECFKINMQSLDSINITAQTGTLLPVYHCPK